MRPLGWPGSNLTVVPLSEEVMGTHTENTRSADTWRKGPVRTQKVDRSPCKLTRNQLAKILILDHQCKDISAV